MSQHIRELGNRNEKAQYEYRGNQRTVHWPAEIREPTNSQPAFSYVSMVSNKEYCLKSARATPALWFASDSLSRANLQAIDPDTNARDALIEVEWADGSAHVQHRC